MRITSLALKDFRNFSRLSLENIHGGVNVFLGENAMGKTNLVEAVNYLSCAKSFRGAQDLRLIREGAAFAGIFARYESGERTGKIEVNILGEGKRGIRINGVPARKLSELMGVLNSVVFAPEDLKTIKEAPSLRRRMMDMELSKIQSVYYAELQTYYSVLRNKNKILKYKKLDGTLLETYNAALAKSGAYIIQKRTEFAGVLEKKAGALFPRLSGKESFSLQYKPSAQPGDEQALFKKLMQIKEREAEAGLSLLGPHREEMDFFINGKDARYYASQGQQRTAMIALKLAFAQIAEETLGEKPLILLDDVFSELDAARRKNLLSLMEGSQVFITATDALGIEGFPAADYYRVKEGTVSKL